MSDNTPKKIQRWVEANGWTLGSHVYHGAFIVSRPDPGGMLGANSRQWAVVHMRRDSKGSRHFELTGRGTSPLNTGAKSMLERHLAEKGVSPRSGPTLRLDGAKTYPVNALA